MKRFDYEAMKVTRGIISHTFNFTDVTFWFIAVSFSPISEVSSRLECNADVIFIVMFRAGFTWCPECRVVSACKRNVKMK